MTTFSSSSHFHPFVALIGVLSSRSEVNLVPTKFTSRHEKLVRVEEFEGEKRENDFDGERATIDEIPVEEIRVVLRRQSVELEDVDQIEELAVDVAADGKLAFGVDCHVHHRRLLREILFDLQ